jgi:hypothetical protein
MSIGFKSYKLFILTACMYLVIVIGLFRFGPSLQLLQSIHADSSNIYPTGEALLDYFGEPWDTTRFNPFGGTLSLLILLAASLYMLVICFIGRDIVVSFLGHQHHQPQIPLLFAGFLIGYTTVLLPLKVIFILFPTQIAAFLCITVLILCSVGPLLTTSIKPSQSGIVLPSFLGIMCVLVVVTYRIQSGRNFLVPDSDIVFLDSAKSFKTTMTGIDFLPTWDQQSDEWIFTAPGIFLSKSYRYDSIWYLLTASFGQISLFFSVYLFSLNSLRKVCSTQWLRLCAWIPSCLIFFSTPSWVPTSYISLFGGQNPVVYLGHAGRYVGLILPCILIYLFEQKSFERDKRRLRQFLFFAGIGFMSIHIAFYFILFGFILLIIKPVWRNSGSKPISPATTLISSEKIRKYLFVPALVGLFLVYVINNRDVSPGTMSIEEIISRSSLILLFGSCVSLFLFKVSVRDVSVKLSVFAHFRRYVFYVFAAFVGFVISGNTLLTFEPFRDGYKWVGSIFPSLLVDPYTRGVGATIPFNLFQFSGAECWITGHCLSVWGFIGAYGIVILLALIALVLYQPSGEQPSIYETLFATTLIVFPLMFFIVDFTGGSELISSWVKTRFLEPAYYYVLVLSWLSIAKFRKHRGLFLVISALWFVPLIMVRIIPQIVTNLVWVVKQGI